MTFSRLDGIDAKIDRAEKQIEDTTAALKTWSAKEQPHGVDREINEGKRRYIFVYKALKPHPPVFSVIGGEIVHDLRSALDHLAAHLVESHGGQVSLTTAWPICESAWKWRTKVERRRRPWQLLREEGAGPLAGIPRGGDAWALIEGSQPYVRSDKARNDPLWELHRLWNTDKHRIVHSLTTYMEPASLMGALKITPPVEPVERRSIITKRQPLKDGTKLAIVRFAEDGPLPDVDVDGDLSLEVALGDEKGDRPSFAEMIEVIRGLVAEAKAMG